MKLPIKTIAGAAVAAALAGFWWWSPALAPDDDLMLGSATIKTYVESPVTPANSSRMGDTTSNWYNAQTFTATQNGTVGTVRVFSRINDGSPSDGWTVQLWTTSAGVPSALISGATVNIPHASIVDGANSWSATEFTTATFGTPASVTNGTVYAVVIFRQGAANGTNYYNPWRHPTTGEGGSDRYAGGAHYVGTSGGVFTAQTGADMATEIDIADAAGGATVKVPDIIIFE